MLRQICVYCASSPDIAPVYFDAAERLAHALAEAGITLVYGGGATGLMGRLADVMLARGGQVRGIIPQFMRELEWAHPGVSDMHFVGDMHERKARFLVGTDALVALPGGCGTLEELLEAITLKRLGLLHIPILILNTAGYYDPLITMLNRAVDEHFMSEPQRHLWQVVAEPEQVLGALRG